MEKKRFLAGAVSIALALTMVSTSAFAVSVEFTDVPSSHWAHTSISEMADKGIMSGVGNNKFAPDTTLTGAQFVTMIVRHFYEDKLGDGGDKWYSAFMDVAEQAGILADTSITAEGVINRYDMAQLMYNVLKDENISTTPLSDTSKVGDWSSVPSTYQDAVSVCYNMGMLSGVDSKGTFNGNGQMTRAQAAVVMDRLIEVCVGDTPSTPVVPEKPDGSVTITSLDQDVVSGHKGAVVVDGGFFFDSSTVATECSSFGVYPGEYTTLSFTVKAIDKDVQVRIGHVREGLSMVDPNKNYGEILGVVSAGQSKAFTVDCSADEATRIWLGDGDFADVIPGVPSSVFVECYLLDITLS